MLPPKLTRRRADELVKEPGMTGISKTSILPDRPVPDIQQNGKKIPILGNELPVHLKENKYR